MTATLISIGGNVLPPPGSYQVTLQDIVKTDRNAAGNTIIERIATKRVIDLGYEGISAADYSTVLNAVSGVTFSVTYYDPETNGNNTGTFYVSDRQSPMLNFYGGVPTWTGVRFQLIEM